MDLLLVVLSTDPRMVLCLEVVDGDAAVRGGNIVGRPSSTVLFRHGILFDAVKKLSGLHVRMYESYRGADAHAILDALDKEYHLNTPWFTRRGGWRATGSTSSYVTSRGQAAVRAAADPLDRPGNKGACPVLCPE
ncbi:hypothetical protein [Rhodococcus sp. JVH1]|uniref:hypothetical protein n=1 Tax=Rhodococcus sp. JVH1 TaxID=745408 RepID=UPI0035244124